MRLTRNDFSHRWGAALALAASSVCLCVTGCSGAYGPPIDDDAVRRSGSGGRGGSGARVMDAGQSDAMSYIIDAAQPELSPDAFFINDPAPPMCGPDGGMSAPPKIEGSADCPADKNREGCPCPKVDEEADCWPGKRVNRSHGICVDGKTTCRETAEFGPAWGACKGYVLPKEGAVRGPEACRCFSNGMWDLSNLVPCIVEDTEGIFLYSSRPNADGDYVCDSVSALPPPTPADNWSTSKLKVDCAGDFELCYTLKAGKASDPAPSDCVLMKTCVDVWYAQAGKTQDLPDLPGWVATDSECAARFKTNGGYGEMSVRGRSIECDPVDDGDGDPYIFERTSYCSPDCNDNPDSEACKDCAVSGSGKF